MLDGKCRTCGGTFPLSPEYWHRRKNSVNGFRHQCKPCTAQYKLDWKWRNPAKVNAYSRQWGQRNPGTAAAWKLRNPVALRKYRGHPEPARPRPPGCEICGRQNGKRVLALDHCHVTGRFRGWLCGVCNLGIGHLGDSAAGVQRALTYLQNSERMTSHE